MAKPRVEYVCESCGGTTVKWQGRCPHCGEWNTMKEFRIPDKTAARFGSYVHKALPLNQVTEAVDLSHVQALEVPRTLVGIEEFDRVTGGGLVSGGVTLIGGDPGIGKSTLLLQVCQHLAEVQNVLYISGEESAEQVAKRAERLGLHSPVRFLAETNLAVILATVEEEKPDFLIVDSIQTIYHEEIASAAGSVSQLRECAAALARMAKSTGTALFIIGHVTKDGSIAGPRVLEHLVDTVLYFEGERASSFRILRAVKNRFGSTNEIGVFEMVDTGLKEIPNPSEVLLAGRPAGAHCPFHMRAHHGACLFPQLNRQAGEKGIPHLPSVHAQPGRNPLPGSMRHPDSMFLFQPFERPAKRRFIDTQGVVDRAVVIKNQRSSHFTSAPED